MKIIIEMDLDSEYADPEHTTGITEEGYQMLCDALLELGSEIVTRPAESPVT